MTPASKFNRSVAASPSASSFIGFSWGPALDAFRDQSNVPPRKVSFQNLENNRPFQTPFPSTPRLAVPASLHNFATPVRPNTLTSHQTLLRTGTVRRTAPRRPVSDREAMKQLVDLVGMSARKKVVESGRKPRILTLSSFPGNRSRSGTLKELRFEASHVTIDRRSLSVDSSRMDTTMLKPPQFGSGFSSEDEETTDTETGTEVPSSPSPTPRPGSAMSIMSRRSQTPTMTGSLGGKGYSRAVPQEADDTARASRHPHHVNDTINDTLSNGVLDDLDQRHAKLIADITGIHRRLGHLASQVS